MAHTILRIASECPIDIVFYVPKPMTGDTAVFFNPGVHVIAGRSGIGVLFSTVLRVLRTFLPYIGAFALNRPWHCLAWRPCQFFSIQYLTVLF